MDSTQSIHGNNPDVKTILILAANPKSTLRIQLDTEVREIDEGLRRGNKREQFRLEQKWAVRQRDFYRAILDYQPQIVHFSGHGAGVDGIVLENEADELAFLNADALASMFKLFATKGVGCVLLNACYSEVQARAISQHVNYVIGMNQTVGDKAAIAFSVAFYDALAAGEQMEFAYELGCSVLISYSEQQTPVLFKKDSLSIIPIEPKVDIIPPNPYQGLAAFGEEDAAFFFGRETFVNGLLEAVNQQPLVGVIGPSGSGKSSIVYAGLFPQLRISGNWVIESFRPGNQPFYQLASALVRQLVPEVDEIQQLRSAAGLDKNIRQGVVTLEQITSRIIERNPDKRLLLFVDQFEELYTLCQKEEQERFADLMLQAIQQKILTLVFTLRADFYGFVLAYRPLRDALQQFTPQLLSAMNQEELLRAIEQPAQKMEVQLEEQLTQRILDDVGNEPGNLPLLEFTMTRLWSLQQNRILTHQAYQEIGGVKKALANHAEQVYQKLSATEQKAAQRIFVQLVRPGEGTEDTRRIATRFEVGDENWGLVSYLAGYTARLVVTGRDEKSSEDTVEVVHEALIREWLTLRKWMNANRQFRVWQERLKMAMLEWKSSNYDSGALLRGVPLGVAQEWLHKRASEMTLEERNFISVSIQQRDREQQEQERRRRRNRNVLISGLVGALSLSGLAFWQWQLAEFQRQQTITGLTTASQQLFDSDKEFDALLARINAGKQVKQAAFGVNSDMQFQVKIALQQAIYGVKEQNRLQGHKAGVFSVSYSPDGKTLASASGDTTVKLWDVATGEVISTLTHKDAVAVVSFSPDGKTLASASGDKTVKLWDVATGKVIFTFNGYEPSYGDNGVSFSPNGQLLAFASEGYTIQVWDVASRQQIATLTGHRERVKGVSFNPNGRLLASVSFDGTAKLWDVASRKEIPTNIRYDSIRNGVHYFFFLDGVSFSPDGRLLAVGGDAGTVELWDVATGKKNSTKFSGFEGRVLNVNFSPNGQLLVASGFNNAIKLWDVATGKKISTLTGHLAQVNNVKFSPDGQWLASASNDHSIKLWYIGERQEIKTLSGHTYKVNGVSFSPNGRLLASGSDDNTVKLWDVSTGQEIKTFVGHKGWVSSVSFSPDGKYLASGSWDDTVKLWDVSTGQEIKTFVGHKHWVTSVSFSPDGKYLASGSWDLDKTVKLWDVATGKDISTLTGHKEAIVAVSFSPDGRLLASASRDQTIKLWDVGTSKEHATLTEPNTELNSVSFSPDGRLLASASDTTIKLWDVGTRKELATLTGHKVEVNSISFSPDGRQLASASNDHTIILWDVATRKEINIFNAKTEVKSISFSPDGQLLASGSGSGTVILWNLKALLNLTLEDLLARGCDWVRGYLQTNPNVSSSDKQLCNGIGTAK